MTRLMSCTEQELRAYRGLDLMPTFVAPSFKSDPDHDDTYAAYNKPGAIIAWLTVRTLPSAAPSAACLAQRTPARRIWWQTCCPGTMWI